jgi:hypothetical protein
MLEISPETVCYIIVKAREFDEKVEASDDDPETESNPSDDRDVGVLEDRPDDPTQQELVEALGSLNVDQQLDLVALMWLGRGDFDSFTQARAQARAVKDKHFPSYLAGTPLLGDYLEEGLTSLGYSCADTALAHL